MVKLKGSIAISENGYVFNPETGESFTINPVGHIILDMLSEGKSYEEIRGDIMSRYDVDDATFEKDFQDFTNVLKQYQIADNEGEKED